MSTLVETIASRASWCDEFSVSPPRQSWPAVHQTPWDTHHRSRSRDSHRHRSHLRLASSDPTVRPRPGDDRQRSAAQIPRLEAGWPAPFSCCASRHNCFPDHWAHQAACFDRRQHRYSCLVCSVALPMVLLRLSRSRHQRCRIGICTAEAGGEINACRSKCRKALRFGLLHSAYWIDIPYSARRLPSAMVAEGR